MITLALCAKTVLAALLIASGSAKLTDIEGFTLTLAVLLRAAGRSERPRLVRLLGRAVPALEAFLGGLAFLGVWPSAIDCLLLAAFVAFAAVTGFSLWRAPETTCRCFGGLSRSRFSRWTLARNLVLVALSLLALREAGHQAPSSIGWSALVMGIGVGFALTCATASYALDELNRPMASLEAMSYKEQA